MPAVKKQEKEGKEEIKREMFPLETRTIIVDGQDREFNFRIIDAAGKWEPATYFSNAFQLPYVGTKRRIEFQVRGLAWNEWEEIELKSPIPSKPEGSAIASPERREHERKRDEALKKRHVHVLEVSTGKSIPGTTIEEKCKFIDGLGTGESETLFHHILERSSNTDDGNLIQSYNQSFRSDGQEIEVIPLTDFSDWAKASEIGSIFRMQRPFEDYIIEIPLKRMTEERKKYIEDNTQEPLPSSKPGKNPTTGVPDPAYPEYNWDDPRWQLAVKTIARKKLVLIFETVMPFEIPGKSAEEKYTWIGSHLLGDVYKIKNFVENEIMSYRGRFNNFFGV